MGKLGEVTMKHYWQAQLGALTIFVPTVPIDGDIAAESVLGFWSKWSANVFHSKLGGCIPRPFGRGEATPRRESPDGLPKVVAINRPCLATGLLAARWCWR